MGAPTILIIEDEERMRRVFDLVLRAEGYRLLPADSGEAGIALVDKGGIDLVLTDFQMGKVSGLDVLEHVTQKCPDVPVVIITGFGTVKSAVEAMKKGAFDYISKPIDNEELKIVVKRALQGKVLKNEVVKLLGDINHDIKNLLTPVVMGTELLESEIKQFYKRRPEVEVAETEASQKICHEVIDMLRDTAHRIQDRTKEIADYVKGLSVPPHFAPSTVAGAVESVMKTLRLVAEDRGIALCREGLDALPPIVADERGLYNMFYNLINNAIEAVPAGGSITVRGEGTPGSDSIVLTVADTGRGMPPEVRDSLFTPGTISRKPGGTGLGTKIVKDVVDVHGGQIAVETKEGVGTTFVIRLPVHPPASVASSP
jgi:signal transduction histidine kinase